MRSIRIPQDRVGTIIGTKGETKKMLQNISGIKIDVDTEGEVTIYDDTETADPLMALKIIDVIKAIGRGFAPDRATRLFDDDEYLEVVDLKETFVILQELIIDICFYALYAIDGFGCYPDDGLVHHLLTVGLEKFNRRLPCVDEAGIVTFA